MIGQADAGIITDQRRVATKAADLNRARRRPGAPDRLPAAVAAPGGQQAPQECRHADNDAKFD